MSKQDKTISFNNKGDDDCRKCIANDGCCQACISAQECPTDGFVDNASLRNFPFDATNAFTNLIAHNCNIDH
jgi:hypothetical protein